MEYRNGKPGRGNAFVLQNNGLQICLHTVAGQGDVWYMDCPALGIRSRCLGRNHFDEAVVQMKKEIAETLTYLQEEAKRLDQEELKFARKRFRLPWQHQN